MLKRFNEWLADQLSKWLATMAMFWVLTVLVLSTLLFQTPSGAQGWVLFIVSIFFQGVALPVLAFVSNKQGDRMERVLRETHDGVLAELADTKAMHAAQAEELAELRSTHNEITALVRSMSEDRQHIVQYLETLANPRMR